MKKLIAVLIVLFVGSSATFAQDGGEEAAPPHGMSPLQAYSLFYQDYKSENYQSALKNGRWILISMPEKVEGYSKYDLATQLDRFITIYSEKAQAETDPSLKTAYIDTADAIFDKVFNKFSENDIDYYQWYLNRGRLYQDNEDFVDDAKAKAASQYMKAYNKNPEEMTNSADGYYVRVLIQDLVSEDTEDSKQQALSIMKKVESYASSDLKGYFDKMRGKLFDTPEEQMGFLEDKVEKNPQDTTALRNLRNIYQNQDMISKAQEINMKLYEMNPSFDNTTALANFAVQNANYQQAIKYLKEAQGKTDENEKLKSIHQSLAQAYLNSSNLRQARNSARKAINIDSNYGASYMTIASAYARTVSSCIEGRDMTRDDRAVYWLVMDYLQKAKNADSSLSGAANSQIQQYRQAAPTDEDIFFVDGWSKGASVSIDSSLGSCYSWIGESTTVR